MSASKKKKEFVEVDRMLAIAVLMDLEKNKVPQDSRIAKVFINWHDDLVKELDTYNPK